MSVMSPLVEFNNRRGREKGGRKGGRKEGGKGKGRGGQGRGRGKWRKKEGHQLTIHWRFVSEN